MKNGFIIIYILFAVKISGQTPLAIPDTLPGPNYTLNLHEDSVQFLPGNTTKTNSFNNFSYLGPTLILHKGSNVSLLVNNQLTDTTTIHWHGLHVAAINDGGPHSMIMSGGTWNPQFKVMDKASTYWYHPHLHRKTGAQVMKGAAGMIIVRDSIEATLNLPRKYGVDDLPIIIQSQQFDSVNQIMPRGMNDSLVLVNGSIANYSHSVFVNVPSQIIRLRLLNASQERTYRFGFTGNKTFSVIGNDGGLLSSPVSVTRLQISPGERAEILLDLNGMSGQNIYLMSYASEIAIGITGGPTMPMPPWSPPMDSPINGIDFNILQLLIGSQTTNAVTTIPSSLVTVTPYLAAQANLLRTISITADSAMTMDGPFYLNGNMFDMMRIDYTIPLNNIEIWKIVNHTMVGHPFHIHGGEFYILYKSGTAPLPEESGRKDVVEIAPYDSVQFIMKFEDFPDTIIPYMYHCHILMHEDDGMMGQYVISPDAVGIKKNNFSETDFQIFPNPSHENIIILGNNSQNSYSNSISIKDISGKEIFATCSSQKQFEISISNWEAGIYFITILTQNNLFTKKLIIQ